MNKKIACIIPARLKSTRFPRKMLAILKDKPLLQWVWNSARKVPFFDEVVFAVDAQETADLIQTFGGKSIMTAESCANGTERLIEIEQKGLVRADIWVNWQGDEPFITEEMVRDLLQSCDDDSDVWTLRKKIINPDEATNPQIAKIVCDHQGYALYFSRSQIPYYRDANPNKTFYKHVGLYAFTPASLRKISQLPPCESEIAEQLEQLRFLHHRLRVRAHETQHDVFGIDLPEHLAQAERRLNQDTVASQT